MMRLIVSGPVAQWLEHGTHNAGVLGSSPSRPTNFALNATTRCSTKSRDLRHRNVTVSLSFITSWIILHTI